MTIEEIKELISVVKDSGIAELEVQRGENRVRIRSVLSQHHDVSLPAVLPVAVTTAASLSGVEGLSSSVLHPASRLIDEPETVTVKSPIVGTYYDAPTEGAPPFKKIGDRVEPRQVLCIIESMKLMNEIEAEIAGIITAKYIENGRPVEYGELLFAIRPL